MSWYRTAPIATKLVAATIGEVTAGGGTIACAVEDQVPTTGRSSRKVSQAGQGSGGIARGMTGSTGISTAAHRREPLESPGDGTRRSARLVSRPAGTGSGR